MPTLSAGDPAPHFSLSDDSGKTIDSGSMHGKRYVLYFHPEDDTPGCTKEACQFNDDLADFDGAGVPVIGVSRDDAGSHQSFRAKYRLRFALATDADRSVHAAFGAWGETRSWRGGHPLDISDRHGRTDRARVVWHQGGRPREAGPRGPARVNPSGSITALAAVAGLAAGIAVTRHLHEDPDAGRWGRRLGRTRFRYANLPVGGTIALVMSRYLPRGLAGPVGAIGVGALLGAVGWGLADPLPSPPGD